MRISLRTGISGIALGTNKLKAIAVMPKLIEDSS